jgi:hypothetical protein
MTNTKLALVAAAALAAAAPALAIDDMTGVYNGKASCRGYAGGVPTRSKADVSLSVAEDTTIRMLITFDAVLIGGTIPVFRIADTAKLDRAKLQGLDCASNVSSNRSLTVVGDVVIKPGSEKGTIKGLLIRRNAEKPGAIEQCTFSAKRTSTELPEILPCPPV